MIQFWILQSNYIFKIVQGEDMVKIRRKQRVHKSEDLPITSFASCIFGLAIMRKLSTDRRICDSKFGIVTFIFKTKTAL